MGAITVEALDTIPLTLTVTKSGVGGVTGLSPVVALRDAQTFNSYLDWADNIFKTSGWTMREALLSEVGGGHYERHLDLPSIGAASGSIYVAEYKVDSTDVKGVDSDNIFIESQRDDLTLLRKMVTNRLIETAGNPGHLVLYDDDGVTPLKTWQLRDGTGGGTQLAIGAPARRSSAT
jgi:hypothetical protein